MGSTGIGRGIAVPHVCLPELDQAYALFCTLDEPIDFDSIDNKPVDLIFTIITPPATGAVAAGRSPTRRDVAHAPGRWRGFSFTKCR